MPGDGVARGSAAASPRFWAIRCSATQPVMPSPSATRSWSGVSSTYSPTWPCIATGMRSPPIEPIDPDVVVVDELAQLGRDRQADLGDARQPVQPRAELLDRLELGGPGRHPLEVLGGPDRDARLGRQRADGVELVRGPVVRPVVVDVEQAEELACRRAAAPCTACRSPPGRRRRGRPRRAGRRGSRRRTAAGGRRRRPPAGTGPGSRGRCRDRTRDRPRLTSAATWPSGCWRKTAARSPSNRTIAWSTRPDRIRSRSSRLPMSLATRRSASARWSRCATSSARWAPLTIAPSASATTRATSRSRGPREPGVSPTRAARPTAAGPGIATASSGRPSGRIASAASPGRRQQDGRPRGRGCVRSRPAASASVSAEDAEPQRHDRRALGPVRAESAPRHGARRRAGRRGPPRPPRDGGRRRRGRPGGRVERLVRVVRRR